MFTSSWQEPLVAVRIMTVWPAVQMEVLWWLVNQACDPSMVDHLTQNQTIMQPCGHFLFGVRYHNVYMDCHKIWYRYIHVCYICCSVFFFFAFNTKVRTTYDRLTLIKLRAVQWTLRQSLPTGSPDQAYMPRTHPARPARLNATGSDANSPRKRGKSAGLRAKLTHCGPKVIPLPSLLD